MRNVELARVFRDIAAYLDMDEVPFKPRAYEKAAQAIESHDRPLDAVYRAGGVKALREIPGIGTSMAEKLEELLTTGKCKLREEYYRRMPVDLAALTALEGVGPKAVKVLYQRLGVRTLADLEAAARAGKARDLPHFGEQSEQKILKALAFVQTSGQRTPPAPLLPRHEGAKRGPPPARHEKGLEAQRVWPLSRHAADRGAHRAGALRPPRPRLDPARAARGPGRDRGGAGGHAPAPGRAGRSPRRPPDADQLDRRAGLARGDGARGP